MQKLLVYTENYLLGGANRYMIDMINGIAGFFDTLVLASNPAGIFQDDISRLKFPYIRKTLPIFTKNLIYHYWLQNVSTMARRFFWIAMLPMEPVVFLYNLVICLVLLIKAKPALVLCCNGGYPGSRSTLIMIVAARIIGLNSVLSIVSTPQKVGRLSLYSRIVDRMINSSTRLVIVNSRMIKTLLEEERHFSGEKIKIIYNGLDDNEHFKDYSDPSQLPAQRVIIGCVCRIEHAKGVTYLVDAYLGIHKSVQSSQLILAGHGDAHDIISRRIKELGLEDKIVLLGQVRSEIVEELVNTFDIYVLPSLHEGFPYSILEAMRAGCAIIATNVGGIPEAIRDDENGVLVEARSSEQLGAALRRLISDRSLRIRLGMNARERFLHEFQLETMHRDLSEILLQVGLVTKRERS